MLTRLHNLRLGIKKRGNGWAFPREITSLDVTIVNAIEVLCATTDEHIYISADGERWERWTPTSKK